MIDADAALLQEALDRSAYAIGDVSFVEGVESKMRGNTQTGGMRADLVLPEEPSPVRAEDVELAVAHEFGIQREALRAHGRAVGLAKAVAVELCCQLSGCRQREVGRRFGYRSDAGVTRQRRALRMRLGDDPGLAARVETVRTRLVQAVKV